MCAMAVVSVVHNGYGREQRPITEPFHLYWPNFFRPVKIFWKVKYVFVAPITFEHVYFLELVPSVMSKSKKYVLYK